MSELNKFEELRAQIDANELSTSLDKLSSLKMTHGLARAAQMLMTEVAIASEDKNGREALSSSPIELKPNLHVGAGSNIIEGFTNVDIFPNEGIDAVFDAREGFPFDDEQFEQVFSEHMLEHVDYPYSVKSVLSEMARITKPGGRVIVGVPDSGSPMRAYAEDDSEYLDKLKEDWYGRRKRLDHYTHNIDVVSLVVGDEKGADGYAEHYWAYDHEKLQSLMEEAGLIEVASWTHEEYSLTKRQWNGIYLQGIKPQE